MSLSFDSIGINCIPCVKVGNFVDDDEESSEADDDESYSPSFTTGKYD